MSTPETSSAAADPFLVEPGDKEILARGHDAESISKRISAIPLGRTPLWMFGVFGVSFALVGVLLVATTYLLFKGTGIWGLKRGSQ